MRILQVMQFLNIENYLVKTIVISVISISILGPIIYKDLIIPPFSDDEVVEKNRKKFHILIETLLSIQQVLLTQIIIWIMIKIGNKQVE